MNIFPVICLTLLSVLLALPGCAARGRYGQPQVAVQNPLLIAASHDHIAWEQAIDILHEFHFQIERENRQARTIETQYRVGSGLLEPWHKDSVGWTNRLESSLQSIRRKVIITLAPAPGGNQAAYAIQVVAIKELEDLNAIAANSPGGATFQESTPLERDLTQVVGQGRPSGWIPQGRDLELEQAILLRLQNLSTVR